MIQAFYRWQSPLMPAGHEQTSPGGLTLPGARGAPVYDPIYTPSVFVGWSVDVWDDDEYRRVGLTMAEVVGRIANPTSGGMAQALMDKAIEMLPGRVIRTMVGSIATGYAELAYIPDGEEGEE